MRRGNGSNGDGRQTAPARDDTRIWIAEVASAGAVNKLDMRKD